MPVKARSFSSADELVRFVSDAQEVSAAAIAVAGTGYTALDELLVASGLYTRPTKIRVDTVGGTGNITGVTVIGAGEYLLVPANPVDVIGGTGSAATFNLTSGDLLVKADVQEIKAVNGLWLLNYWV